MLKPFLFHRIRQEALRSLHRAEQVKQAERLEEERQKAAAPKAESYPPFLTLARCLCRRFWWFVVISQGSGLTFRNIDGYTLTHDCTNFSHA